jgi:GNAT superfamily N-acetyltransferase
MTLEIRPLGFSRRDRRRFVRVSFDLHRADPNWVPPLWIDVLGELNPAKNPFFEHATVQHLLALRDGVAVGRIAAIVNHRHNEFHDARDAHFGWFEAADEEVANELLAAAEAWAAERGTERVLGPVSYSTNDVCGLLVDGFDVPPAILMPYNPRAYGDWIEGRGFAKAKDLLALHVDRWHRFDPRLIRVAERLAHRSGLQLRPLDMKRFDEEVALVSRLYNAAWERNWGFVPLTDAELEHMARSLKPVVDPKLVLFAEIQGQTAGFSLALPDLYRILVKIRSGRLLPFGVFRILRERKKLKNVRLLTLGVTPEFRSKGIDAALIHGAVTKYVEAGYDACECSWILEDNERMLSGMETVGGRTIKRYRIYEKALAPSS